MSKDSNEAWVTFVENDEELQNALVLAISIRKTYTNRKIVALYGPQLSMESLKTLALFFDIVHQVNQDKNGSQIDAETWAKIYLWSLPGFQKSVYINSNYLMIQNCDDLFAEIGTAVTVGRMDVEGNIDTSVMVITPSLTTFLEILDHIKNGGNNHERSSLKDFLISKTTVSQLESRFLTTLDCNSPKSSTQFLDYQPSLARFDGTQKNALSDGTINAGFAQEVLVFRSSLLMEITERLYKAKSQKMYEIKVQKNKEEPIAVVGMACRLPGANTVEEFWELMMTNGDAIKPLPQDRWSFQQFGLLDAETKNVQAGWLKGRIDYFDAQFFGISPAELTSVDPQQRLLLEITWEALEDAAINPLSLEGSYVGIFSGQWTNNYRDVMLECGYLNFEYYRMYMGNYFGATASRLAHFLEVTGPNISTESGCSSSMVAVGLAVKSLRTKETNLAIASGVNLLVHPYKNSILRHVLSKTGRSRSFDESADGFVRADGCGVLILKRFSDAVKDNNRIHALIRGYGASQEGKSKSMGTPTVSGESLAMKLALKDANLHPLEVSFVEAHGTGTPVGDPLEIKAITEVYSKGRNNPLVIGAVKTNVGHTESCSGITGIIKTILALQKEIIPPTRTLDVLNSNINLEAIPAVIPTTPTEWKRQNGIPRIAGVSSFGITGTNAHVILEEAPPRTELNNNCRLNTMSYNLVTLSAKSESSINKLVELYQLTVSNNFLMLDDVAVTANQGRAHFRHRVAVVAKNTEDLLKQLESGSMFQGLIEDLKPKICFLFTGQGSQYFGMGKELYENFPAFRKVFDVCDNILQSKFNINIQKALWGTDKELLGSSLYSQTSIFVIEYSLTKLWESWNIKPDCVLGHSLGEFAAATAAGILDLNDALLLVGTRSRLLDALQQGKMIVVKASADAVKHLLKIFQGEDLSRWLDFAAINSSEQVTLAGSANIVEEFALFCETNSTKIHILDATHAFHSRHMDAILQEYRVVAEKIVFCSPKCMFISGVDGEQLTTVNAEYWVRHTRNAVQFADASHTAYSNGFQTFLEIGPHPVLCALVKSNSPKLETKDPAFFHASMKRNTDEIKTLMEAVANLYIKGFNIDWTNFHKCHQKKTISLPFYPFQRSPYWFDPEKYYNWKTIRPETYTHPLVGSQLQSPEEKRIFHNFINTRKVPFILDHQVGDHVIFPGAGFLEMTLAAGYTSLFSTSQTPEKPEQPLTVQNLMIRSPLEFIDNKTYELQTVVSSLEGDDAFSCKKVVIYSRRRGFGDQDALDWHCHSEAKFIDRDLSESSPPQLELTQLQTETDVRVEEIYSHLKSLGYNFGPAFQSMSQIWKNDNGVLIEVNVPNDDLNEYMLHPIVTDAMIQACILASSTKIEQLQLPILIKNFVWYGKHSSKPKYIYFTKANTALDTTVALYDESGNVLASMSGAELIKTTLSKFEKSLAHQRNKMIDLYEESWRKSKLQQTIFDKETEPCLDLLKHTMDLSIPVEPDSVIAAERLHWFEGTTLGIIKDFKLLGWEPSEIGQRIEAKELRKTMNIDNESIRLFEKLLEILCEDNYLQASKKHDGVYKVITLFPEMEAIEIRIKEIGQSFQILNIDWNCTLVLIEELPKILTGKVSPLAILFGTTGNDGVADKIYSETHNAVQALKLLIDTIEYLLSTKYKPQNYTKTPLRILEVGAGTGSVARLLLPILQTSEINFTYDFTDMSEAFASKAKSLLEEPKNNMRYSNLNIEEDPKSQGFLPHSYDLVIASNVLHVTKDLKETCKNIRNVIKKCGILVLNETLKPHRLLDISFGALPGYWQFKDFQLRPKHCTINGSKWENLLKSVGFSVATTRVTGQGYFGVVTAEASQTNPQYKIPAATKKKYWIIFSDSSELPKQIIDHLQQQDRTAISIFHAGQYKKFKLNTFAINGSSKSDMEAVFTYIKSNFQDSLCEGILYFWGLNALLNTELLVQSYLFLLQSIVAAGFKKPPRLYLITTLQMYVGDQDAKLPIVNPLLGMSRTFRTEYREIFTRTVDLDYKYELELTSAEQIIFELWTKCGEPLVAYRQGVRYTPRLISVGNKLGYSELDYPKTNQFSLVLSKNNTVEDLKFGSVNKSKLNDNEVEIEIKACGLNFRDIFSILKPTEQFNNLNSVGADIAGIITKLGPNVKNRQLGDAVIALNFQNTPMPSHIVIAENYLVSLPNSWTFAEGATLPCVFATAYHCLITAGTIKAGETILIHTASGGVGLSAIQLAKHVGATIIATAGSKRKRTYLKSIGIKHVFNSRDLTFGEQIMEVTNGKGVDVVLNSLTGPGFKETSLKCCSKNARFLEMSKLNVWTIEEVFTMRPDVKYTIEDLSDGNTERCIKLMDKLGDLLTKNIVQPLPYTAFPSNCVRDALKYLEKAKQIGKVVCLMPEVEISNNIVTIHHKLFNDRSSYLITGGLGGIGLEVAKWMTEMGAKYIVLCGRSLPTEEALAVVEELRNAKNTVLISQTDVGIYSDCENLLSLIKDSKLNLPPLRGIMHSAGCLNDGAIQNQSWDKFQITMNPKVNGGWNLHLLTKNINLEHFVMFSTFAAIVGSPGQSTHAAANTYLDSLAQYRNAIGLPATTINWGQWGEIGVAKNIEMKGVTSFSPASALNVLEHALKSNCVQLTAIDWDIKFWKTMLVWAELYLEELQDKSQSRTKMIKMPSSEAFWKELNTCEIESRTEVVKKNVSKLVIILLQFDENYEINPNQEFAEFGMDSLTLIEFRNQLQVLLGDRVVLSGNDMADARTLNQLSEKLVELIFSGPSTLENKVAQRIKRNELILKDCELWSHIKGAEIEAVHPSAVKTVLLTGVTGYLGPYMLKNLTQRSHVKKIYCLIRPSPNTDLKTRFESHLKKIQLDGQIELNKVELVEGDIGNIALGLSSSLYDSLAIDVDAVIHCAVYVNHLEQYRIQESKNFNLRETNVIGTQRLLEFAGTKRTKLFYNASTFLSMWASPGTVGDEIPEDWPNPEDADTAPDFGYGLSKHVADTLLGRAVNKGIPCKAFRFPKITGDSKTGFQFVKDNHFFLKFLHFIKSEMMPSLEVPMQLLPVDVCADISLELFFNDFVPSGMYNMLNPHNQKETELAIVAKELGYSIKTVEYDEFIKDLTNQGQDSLIYKWTEFYTNEDTLYRVRDKNADVAVTLQDLWQEDAEKLISMGKVAKFIPNIKERIEKPLDIIRRDIKYAKENVDGLGL